MKKLLSLLGALGLAASAGSAVIACGDTKNEATEQKADLSSVIKTTEVGEIKVSNNKSEISELEVEINLENQIIKAMIASNQRKDEKLDLDPTDFWVSNLHRLTENGDKYEATVSTHEKSVKYKGSITVKVTVTIPTSLLIKNDDLGAIDNEAFNFKNHGVETKIIKDKFLDKVVAKNPNLKFPRFISADEKIAVNKLSIEDGNEARWSFDNDEYFIPVKIEGRGTTNISFTPKDMQQIDKVVDVKTKDLGEMMIPTGAMIPTGETIQEAIIKKNESLPGFKNLRILAKDITSTGANIKLEGSTGELGVKYSIPVSAILKADTDLGELNDLIPTDAIPTDAAIIDKIVEITDGSLKDAIKITNKTSKGATITIDGYTKETTVKYSIPVNLVVEKDTDLKSFDAIPAGAIIPTSDKIIEKIKEIKDLKIASKDFTVSDITSEGAKITIEGYTKETTVKFSIPVSAIITADLGEINLEKDETKPTANKLIELIKNNNSALRDLAIVVTDGSITTSDAKVTVKGYEGSVKVNFTVKPFENPNDNDNHGDEKNTGEKTSVLNF